MVSEWPNVSILIPTYNRAKIVRKTIELLQEHLRYDGRITYHISADGNDDTEDEISNLDGVVFHTGPKAGLGANLNHLIRSTTDDYLMQMDDDHHLLSPLNLNPHIKKLRDDDLSGWIRLMGVGFHRYIADLDGDYWRIRWNSRELYIPSMRPHLKHRRFHNHYGFYPTGRTLGQTEEAWCHICRNIYKQEGGPFVLIPLRFNTEESWDHVGESWQRRGL